MKQKQSKTNTRVSSPHKPWISSVGPILNSAQAIQRPRLDSCTQMQLAVSQLGPARALGGLVEGLAQACHVSRSEWDDDEDKDRARDRRTRMRMMAMGMAMVMMWMWMCLYPQQ